MRVAPAAPVVTSPERFAPAVTSAAEVERRRKLEREENEKLKRQIEAYKDIIEQQETFISVRPPRDVTLRQSTRALCVLAGADGACEQPERGERVAVEPISRVGGAAEAGREAEDVGGTAHELRSRTQTGCRRRTDACAGGW